MEKQKFTPLSFFFSFRISNKQILSVGLRIDGRVRASGSGSPPWAAFAAQLPPMEGVFKGSSFFFFFGNRVERGFDENSKNTHSLESFSAITQQDLETASTGACDEKKRKREPR